MDSLYKIKGNKSLKMTLFEDFGMHSQVKIIIIIFLISNMVTSMSNIHCLERVLKGLPNFY